MASPFKDNVNSKLLMEHVDLYSRASRTCAQQLATIYQDLELDDDEQRHELDQVCSRATSVWTQAVEDASARRNELRHKIEEALREITKIKQQLGDDGIQAEIEHEVAQLQGSGGLGPRKSLKAWLAETKQTLEMWRGRRALRVQEYEDLQFEVKALKQQMGFPTAAPPGAPDITRSSLELLRLERDKMLNERERRLRRLDSSLARLRSACQELGEDEKFAAAGVHVSLRAALSSDPDSSSVLASMYKMTGKAAGPTVAGAAELALDLSDSTFLGLQRKVDSLSLLKAEREAHAHELLQVLESLWQALGIDEMAGDRALFITLMTGPYRLHGKSLEKCMGEVRRLEGCKTQQMRDLINCKARELTELCQATHVPAPDLGPMLAEVSAKARAEERGAGQLADVLAKLVHMLAEVRAIAEKRGAICALIVELEDARAEAAWLRAYEADGERYKGRDANRKLQRAIKAAKVRDRIPQLMEAVADALHEWSVTEGEPFLYDGQDYAGEVLEQVAEEVAQHEVEKQAKTRERRATSAATAVAAGGPRGTPAAGRPGTSSGSRTPQPKGAALSYSTKEDISAHLSMTPKAMQKRMSLAAPVTTPASRAKAAPSTPQRARPSVPQPTTSLTPNPIKEKLSRIMAQQTHQHNVATLQRAKSPLPSPNRSGSSHSMGRSTMMSGTASDVQAQLADVTSKLAAMGTASPVQSRAASDMYMSPSKVGSVDDDNLQDL